MDQCAHQVGTAIGVEVGEFHRSAQPLDEVRLGRANVLPSHGRAATATEEVNEIAGLGGDVGQAVPVVIADGRLRFGVELGGLPDDTARPGLKLSGLAGAAALIPDQLLIKERRVPIGVGVHQVGLAVAVQIGKHEAVAAQRVRINEMRGPLGQVAAVFGVGRRAQLS